MLERMQTPSETAKQMQETLAQYVPVIRSWMTAEGELLDPYETNYSENYAPANAAVVLASVLRHSRNEEAASLLSAQIARSVQLLADREGVNPFCRVFLYHYSLMALLIAPEDIRKQLVKEHGGAFAGYENDCGLNNTNSAALQWAMELFTEALGLRAADPELLRRRLEFIAAAQSPAGFINDDISEQKKGDGMPIAYHVFTMFILSSALAVLGDRPEHKAERLEAERIVTRGLSWLSHAISADGYFAMIERSRYQMFTWGAIVAIHAFNDPQDSQGLLASSFRLWLPYRKEDGTYSCTPNELPHSFRVGYEGYTHLNMYNLLGLTGIAVALQWLERSGVWPAPKGSAAEAADAGGHDAADRSAASAGSPRIPIPDSVCMIDPDSGYAFYRQGSASFGCALRVHERKYAPAMQGFHYRIGSRKLPLAEAKLPGWQNKQLNTAEGIWEGFLITMEDGSKKYPDWMENAAAEPLDNGFALAFEDDDLICRKTIRISADSIEWGFRLELKTAIRSCEHAVPLIVHDGRHPLLAAAAGKNRIKLQYAGASYVLECSRSSSFHLDLTRSLLSVSGAASKARAVVSGPLPAGASLEWTTVLRVQTE